MPTLSPQAQFNVTPESPVNKPSFINGLAGLVDTGARVFDATQKASTSSGGVSNLDQALLNGLNKAQALRDEGRESEANQMERRISVNYMVQGGNPASAGTKQMIESYTGRPFEYFGFSPEEVSYKAMAESEEYKQAFAGTYATDPEATDQERAQIAASKYAKSQANKTLIEEAKWNWSSATEGAFIDEINTFNNNLLGQVAIQGKYDTPITREQIQGAQAELAVFKTQVVSQRPAGITDEQWKPIENRLKVMETSLTLLRELQDPENISANAMSKVLQAIQSQPDTVENALLTKILSSDPQVWVEVGAISQQEVVQLMGSVQGPAGAYNTLFARDKLLQSDFNPDEGQPAANLEGVELYKSASDAMTMSNLVSPTNIMEKAKSRSEWGIAVTSGLTRNKKLAARGDWQTAEEYTKQFSPQFFANLEAVRTSDPELYKAISARAQSTFTVIGETLNERLISITKGTALEYNPSTNSFRVTREGAERLLKGKPDFGIVDKAIQAEYGGSYEAAYADNGALFQEEDERRIWESLTGRLEAGGEVEATWFTQAKAATNAMNAIYGFQKKIADMGEPTESSPSASQYNRPKWYNGTATGMIAHFEGFKEEAYYDVNAHRAGYGSDTVTYRDGTVEKIKPGMTVTREDAQRDLNRRTQEFSTAARRKVGRDEWAALPVHVSDTLTSIAYNYGSIPNRILGAVRSGDIEAIASAVEGLAGDNDGINRKRRMQEAAIIRGEDPTGITGHAPRYYGGAPMARPEGLGGTEEGDTPIEDIVSSSSDSLDVTGAIERTQHTAPITTEKLPDPPEPSKAAQKAISENEAKLIAELIEAAKQSGSVMLKRNKEPFSKEEIEAMLKRLGVGE